MAWTSSVSGVGRAEDSTSATSVPMLFARAASCATLADLRSQKSVSVHCIFFLLCLFIMLFERKFVTDTNETLFIMVVIHEEFFWLFFLHLFVIKSFGFSSIFLCAICC
jgi:hypothetical protein